HNPIPGLLRFVAEMATLRFLADRRPLHTFTLKALAERTPTVRTDARVSGRAPEDLIVNENELGASSSEQDCSRTTTRRQVSERCSGTRADIAAGIWLELESHRGELFTTRSSQLTENKRAQQDSTLRPPGS